MTNRIDLSEQDDAYYQEHLRSIAMNTPNPKTLIIQLLKARPDLVLVPTESKQEKTQLVTLLKKMKAKPIYHA